MRQDVSAFKWKTYASRYNSGGNCADLNTIPTLLLDRVEVLTGGASSIYGSDAVAGVVNFILDDDFEGFKAHTSTAFTIMKMITAH